MSLSEKMFLYFMEDALFERGGKFELSFQGLKYTDRSGRVVEHDSGQEPLTMGLLARYKFTCQRAFVRWDIEDGK